MQKYTYTNAFNCFMMKIQNNGEKVTFSANVGEEIEHL